MPSRFRVPTPQEATAGQRPALGDPVPEVEPERKSAEQAALEAEHLQRMTGLGFANGRPSNRALREGR